jgi:probable DNA metabolism protein
MRILSENSHFLYSYDDSFEGFITAVYRSLHTGKHPSSITPDEFCQIDLFHDIIFVPTDVNSYNLFCDNMKIIAGKVPLEKIYHAYLAEKKNIETAICRYIELSFSKGKSVLNMITHDDVQQIETLSLYVCRETHRYLGFVRFSEICSNILYSRISPVNNILGLIAPHFADRLKGCKWLIYDTTREIAAVSDGSYWFITDNIPDGIIVKTDEEVKWQGLWKMFFKTIAIEERNNPHLQNKLMPKRYRQHITEFN